LASPISPHTWIDTIKITRMIKLIKIILYKFGLKMKLIYKKTKKKIKNFKNKKINLKH